MPNFKKFAALSLGAVCLLASCNKTLNAENAKKFIETNYGNKTVKDINYVSVNYAVKYSDNDEAKNKAKELIKANAEFCGKTDLKDNEYSFNIDKLSADTDAYIFIKKGYASDILIPSDIDDYESYRGTALSKIIYTTSGKEMSIYTEGSYTQNPYYNTVVNGSVLKIYNENGMCRYFKSISNYPLDEEGKNVVKLTGVYSIYYK